MAPVDVALVTLAVLKKSLTFCGFVGSPLRPIMGSLNFHYSFASFLSMEVHILFRVLALVYAPWVATYHGLALQGAGHLL